MEETKEITYKRTSAFLIQRSNGDDIKIDQEELDGVLEGWNKGAIIIVKRGIVNPSFITGVVPDKNRISEWKKTISYDDTRAKYFKAHGMKPLETIFKDTGTKIEQALIKKQAELKSLTTNKPKELKNGKQNT